jgi:glutathione S-transferase
MALVFYSVSGSPLAWRVWLSLEHKRIRYEHVMLSLEAKDHEKPEFVAISPRRKVPAIVDDGFALYEAEAIVEYLEDRFGGEHRLFPSDVRKRATCRRMIREIDEYIVPPQFAIAAQVLFKSNPADWDLAEIEKARARLSQEIARIEPIFEGDFLFGAPSAADFSLYPLLAIWRRFELRKPDLGLVAAWGPSVRRWVERVEALPYFENTYPPHWRQAETAPTPAFQLR